MEIAGTDQGGLGLPDRDYYLKTDAKKVRLTLRNQYEQHVANMFNLLGESPEKMAAADAKTVAEHRDATRIAGLDGPH